ncbi:hypothetical protein DPEC_G00271870 [Dallia pectoralis]|uniref:Uncharacterized protein n=1 Tax=Dallia pectoralis TaxID=75939 RepID=A0ACC2FPV6_DALPE|nr:hypothetical protein DPEC_G00271870 [Dallia pectoralis]
MGLGSKAVQWNPREKDERLRDPSSRLSWTESSFLASMMSQNQSGQGSDLLSQDVFNQLLEMLDQSAFHSVQPIELNFSDDVGDRDRPAGNTIQISMDCITMHEGQEAFTMASSTFSGNCRGAAEPGRHKRCHGTVLSVCQMAPLLSQCTSFALGLGTRPRLYDWEISVDIVDS